MEFWGVEVKNGKPCSVDLDDDRVVHLSQACLVEGKDDGSEPIYLYVTINEKKLVLGTLSYPDFPQQQFDLVFDKSFKLSHSWKKGTVQFMGYKSNQIYESDYSDSEFGEDVPVPITHEVNEKPATQAAKQKVNLAGPGKNEKEGDSSDDTDSSDDELDSDEDETSESDSSEDEVKESKAKESSKKVEKVSKKRPNESASETPGKKAKFVTPKKTGADNKKDKVHVDTPYPSKKKAEQKPSESAGSHACGPCKRSFKSEQALESHSKAKHSNEKSK